MRRGDAGETVTIAITDEEVDITGTIFQGKVASSTVTEWSLVDAYLQYSYQVVQQLVTTHKTGPIK